MRRCLAGLLGLLVLLSLFAPSTGAQEDDEVLRTLEVQLMDEGCPEGADRFCISPAEIELEEGHTLVLEITNEGRVSHNLTFAPGTPAPLADHGMNGTLAPNETVELRLPWSAIEEAFEQSGQSELVLQCGVDGHATLGERIVLTVAESMQGEERPQPGPGAVLALAVLIAVAALVRRR